MVNKTTGLTFLAAMGVLMAFIACCTPAAYSIWVEWNTPETKTVELNIYNSGCYPDEPEKEFEGWTIKELYFDGCGNITLELTR